jgi:hypothetical protein
LWLLSSALPQALADLAYGWHGQKRPCSANQSLIKESLMFKVQRKSKSLLIVVGYASNPLNIDDSFRVGHGDIAMIMKTKMNDA